MHLATIVATGGPVAAVRLNDGSMLEIAKAASALSDGAATALQSGILQNVIEAGPEALEAIRDAGRRVIILSNSGKRAALNIERLQDLGIDRYLFDDLMTL